MYPKEVFKPNGEKKMSGFWVKRNGKRSRRSVLVEGFYIYPTGEKQGHALVPSIRLMSFSHQTLKSAFHMKISQKW